MRRPTGWIIVGWALLSQSAVGDEIYRSVDAEGNVTFTDTRPAGNTVERVELPPGPSEETLRQTEQRNREIRNAAEQAERKRLQRQQEKTARIEAAKKELADAQAKLADAKTIKDEDRQHLAGGKRRLDPGYFERIEQAEAAVEAARKALQAARGY